jgi:hypothetical protein
MSRVSSRSITKTDDLELAREIQQYLTPTQILSKVWGEFIDDARQKRTLLFELADCKPFKLEFVTGGNDPKPTHYVWG